MRPTMIELAPNHKRGLTLARPLMNAAGTLGFAGEARGHVDLGALGAFVTNPFTWTARTPAAPPNVVELPDGVLVHTGLPNPGLRAGLRTFAREWARDCVRRGVPVIVHLAATTPAEVAAALELLDRDDRVSGVELGLRDDVDEAELRAVVRAGRGGPPLMVRLPLAQAETLSRAAVESGADALTIAAPPREAVEVDGRMVRGRFYGPGQAEPARAALGAVLAQALEVPVIAAGGLFSGDLVRARLADGAAAVQLDAVLWRQPDGLADLTP